MVKSLLYAVGPFVFDSLWVLVCAMLLGLGASVALATVAGTVAAVAVVGWEVARGRRPAPLQWIRLAMVLVSAAATLLTGDPRFLMIKPTIVYLIVAAAMLRRGWKNRYIPHETVAGGGVGREGGKAEL